MIYETLLLLSEIVLSSYPLLIKLVNASVTFQTGLRMMSYTILALFAGWLIGVDLKPTVLFSGETAATGFLNLVHVIASYTAFDQLAGGNAMALFYTYPVWNILGSAAVFGEKLQLGSLPWIGLALIGAVLLAKPTTSNWTLIGIAAALTAALTETGIYLWFKSHGDSVDEGGSSSASAQPFTKMAQMYGSSGVLWAIGVAMMLGLGYMSKSVFNISGAGLASILTYNSIVGFLGYALRFYLIPQVSTVTFSALSFFGVIAAYGFSWMFTGEVPTITQGLGAAAIVIANTVLLRKENV
jgi:drug/metabolite transporter (DMT)-like permease